MGAVAIRVRCMAHRRFLAPHEVAHPSCPAADAPECGRTPEPLAGGARYAEGHAEAGRRGCLRRDPALPEHVSDARCTVATAVPSAAQAATLTAVVPLSRPTPKSVMRSSTGRHDADK